MQVPVRDKTSLATELEQLAPWSHYYRFGDSAYTGYSPSLVQRYGRTWCTEDDSLEMCQAFADLYRSIFERSRRFLLPCDILKKVLGSEFFTYSFLDLSCNDGLKSLYLTQIGAGNVHGVEIRKDCIQRAIYVRDALGFSTHFTHHPISADNDFYADNLYPADVVCSFGVLYHLEKHSSYIRNLRMLTKRCLLIFSSYVHNSQQCYETEDLMIPYKSITGKRKTPFKNNIVQLLHKAGFSAVFDLTYNPKTDSDDYTKSCAYMLAYV